MKINYLLKGRMSMIFMYMLNESIPVIAFDPLEVCGRDSACLVLLFCCVFPIPLCRVSFIQDSFILHVSKQNILRYLTVGWTKQVNLKHHLGLQETDGNISPASPVIVMVDLIETDTIYIDNLTPGISKYHSEVNANL